MQPQSPGGQLPPAPNGSMLPNAQFPQTPTGAFKPPKGHSHLGWIIAISVTAFLLLAAIGFGIWAYTERDTYKTKSDEIVKREVDLAVQKNTSEKEKEFTEREKNPFKKYNSPSQFGSVSVTYPKTWAAFVTEKDNAQTHVDGYFHPNFVPGIDSGTSFALRIEVVNQSYDSQMKLLEAKVKSGKVKVTPFRAAKVPQVLGARIDGEINNGQKDSMVMFPIRDKTLKVYTETEQFLKDFNDIILPNLVFVP
jgi:hypothetical protein